MIETILKDFRLFWGLAPKGSLKYKKGKDLEKFIAEACERVQVKTEMATAKAFGSCAHCYGKGYATVINQYSDESAGTKWSKEEMSFCICERGKQLEKLLSVK